MLRTDRSGGVLTVTIDRVERHNALSPDLLTQLVDTLDDAADDDAVSVVVLTGTGRYFSVGGDLADFATGLGGMGVAAATSRLRAAMRVCELLHGMPKPTIAAINGACAGAGLALACAADLRLASENAVFNTAFLTAGVSGDFGGTWTLPRIVGPAKARELYLLSEKFGAAEAAAIGLVSRVVPDEELAGVTAALAAELAARAPLALRRIKQNLNDSARTSFAEQLNVEADRHVRSLFTQDAQEAAVAFLQKRPPSFTGR